MDPRVDDGELADRIEALERRWRATAPADDGTIRLLVVRTAGGHVTPATVELSPAGAIHGDRWSAAPAPHPEAQVSLIERRVVALLAGDDPARWHLPGDNLVVDLDLSVDALPVGARLSAGAVVLEITAKPHRGCATFRDRLGAAALAWINEDTRRPRRLRGVYARVIAGGTLAIGDRLAR